MKRLILTALVALAACGSPPTTATTEAPPSAAASSAAQSASGACTARAVRDWTLNGKNFTIEASADGPSCRNAVASLTIRNAASRALYTVSYPIERVPLAFNPNADATRLASDLQAWIAGSDEHRTADQLPAWPEGAAAPPGFDPKVQRIAYEGWRTEKAPILCFPDGGESNACITLAPGFDLVSEIGSLTPDRD